ncbi:MAG: cell division protein FtsQ [Paracoccaceae bacterium]|jgi:cell division protein FtsQ
MQPLSAPKRDHHDPSPSRTSYRMQRLWLTPVFRAILRTGVPVLSVLAVGAWYVSNEARIDHVKSSVSEMRASIEHRPEFMVNLMRIEDVSAEVAEDIREITAVDFPTSSFDLDLDEMRNRIEELDAVAQANLVVRAGGVLDVEVVERVGKIIWRGREALELLDGNGHRVSALASRAAHLELPLIAGEGADKSVPEAMALFSTAASIAPRVRGLLRVGERRWDLILDRNQRIMLPEVDAVAALERVLGLHDINELLTRDLVTIDLRDGRRPTLRLSSDALEFLFGINDPDAGLSPKDGEGSL